MEFLKKNAYGIGACLAIAIPSWLLGRDHCCKPVDAARAGDMVDKRSAKTYQ